MHALDFSIEWLTFFYSSLKIRKPNVSFDEHISSLYKKASNQILFADVSFTCALRKRKYY